MKGPFYSKVTCFNDPVDPWRQVVANETIEIHDILMKAKQDETLPKDFYFELAEDGGACWWGTIVLLRDWEFRDKVWELIKHVGRKSPDYFPIDFSTFDLDVWPVFCWRTGEYPGKLLKNHRQ